MNHQPAHLTLMSRAVMKASKNLIRDFNEVYHLQQNPKNIARFVVNSHERSQAICLEELDKSSANTPKYTIQQYDKEPEQDGLVIFPLEGIENFLHGIPLFAVGCALVRDNVTSAFFYLPVFDEYFWVDQKEGAFYNQKKMHVGGRSSLSGSFIGGTYLVDKAPQDLLKIRAQNAQYRSTGCDILDILHVSCGKLDATVIHKISQIKVEIFDLFLQHSRGTSLMTKTSTSNCHIAGNADLVPSLAKLL